MRVHAASPKPELEKIEGFISAERFQSLSDPDKILSLSFFENETAVARWRTLPVRRGAQSQGRGGVFRDCCLRVAAVIRDCGMTDRQQELKDSRAANSQRKTPPRVGAAFPKTDMVQGFRNPDLRISS